MSNSTDYQSNTANTEEAASGSANRNGAASHNCHMAPCDVFSIAGAIALMLYREFTLCQLYVIINLIGLLVANLNAIITQMEINRGDQPSTLV